ncbi:winged helix-turn-helix transcriptional regulator [Altericroceibacterium spongiae]|nr:helix-turn-helix domain-containing protein [Altericroceibacterium spongiae]
MPSNNTAEQSDESPAPGSDAIEQGTRVIGTKWSGAILWELQRGALRFNEIVRSTGASQRMISKRLRELQEAGLVQRDVSCDPPIYVHYALSPKGTASLAALREVGQWANTCLTHPEES